MARRSYDYGDDEDDIDVGAFMQQQADRRSALLGMALKMMEMGQSRRQNEQDLALKREAADVQKKYYEGQTEAEKTKADIEREKLAAGEVAETEKGKRETLKNRAELVAELSKSDIFPKDLLEGMIGNLSPEDAELLRQRHAGRLRQAIEVAQPMVGAIYEKHKGDPKKLKEALSVAFQNPAQFGGMEALKGVDYERFNQAMETPKPSAFGRTIQDIAATPQAAPNPLPVLTPAQQELIRQSEGLLPPWRRPATPTGVNPAMPWR